MKILWDVVAHLSTSMSGYTFILDLHFEGHPKGSVIVSMEVSEMSEMVVGYW